MTLWTVAHQAPLSLEFSKQEYWVACHSLLQGIFLTQGLNLGLLHCRWILYLWVSKEAQVVSNFLLLQTMLWWISGGASGKGSACQCRKLKWGRSTPGLGKSPGEENGNPFQYFMLENSLDRGAWLSTVLGIAKSWTQLKWLSTHRGMGWISFLFLPSCQNTTYSKIYPVHSECIIF